MCLRSSDKHLPQRPFLRTFAASSLSATVFSTAAGVASACDPPSAIPTAAIYASPPFTFAIQSSQRTTTLFASLAATASAASVSSTSAFESLASASSGRTVLEHVPRPSK